MHETHAIWRQPRCQVIGTTAVKGQVMDVAAEQGAPSMPSRHAQVHAEHPAKGEGEEPQEQDRYHEDRGNRAARA